ncbi:MAG: molybdate ABC transporter permease subunit [Hyphomicrobiales bacterium]|nr:molybdate ABC transporter permease subunit [Hyphomicrobiales bacterium]MDG1523538.1 molybdate ABC transporter permease subunit [Hyphomicrobiales bacterium]MDG1664551.1 molybdate ABC transporter permease subunit [Hyphomicrobiales bacterium]MDG2414382.1 molybdate ABC transporter permease subunit [Hyphomicrobiales bacterium]
MTDFEINALLLSIKIGILSTILILVPGIFMGWVLAKKNFFGKIIVDSLIHLPLVIPPIGIGYILLIIFGKNSFLGNFLFENFNINLSFSWIGAALACSIMSFPLMVRPIRVLMEAQDKKLDEAARTLGASELKIFLSITLPLAYPGILAGLVLSFARSIGEFGATIAFVGNIPGETQTLPLALWTLIETSNSNNEIIRLGLISVCLSLLALLISTSIEKTFLDKLKNGKK